MPPLRASSLLPLLQPLVLLLLLPAAAFSRGLATTAAPAQAEQIHIAFTGDVTEMQVTYSTFEDCNTTVMYGQTEATDSQVEGSSVPFAQGKDGQHLQFIHRATMTGLEPGEKYYYRVSGPAGLSDLLWFTAIKRGVDWSPRLVVYGDLGAENGRSLPRIAADTSAGLYDAALHVGDFAYDMDSESGEVGDRFMRQAQPVAGFLPYMTCPGNHEQAGNFSNYKNRFSMPGDTASMFYSFDMGPVHFVAVSSEFYYFTNYGYHMATNQYNWLKTDLEAASEPSARSERPWIVVFGHRPMYCTNLDSDDCTRVHDLLRVGIPSHNIPGLEDLLYQNGVDLAIWAHEHSYERLWPVYRFNVFNGSAAEPYTNPGAPVHITTGSAGCKENHDPFQPVRPSWSAFRNTDYGYSRLTFHNASHASWQQVSDDQGGAVIDRIWVVRETHRPYAELTRTQAGRL